MRTPSLSWVMVSKSWFAATLFGWTNGLLCAETWVRFEYFLLQNSGQPLQGWVLVGSGSSVSVDVGMTVVGSVSFMLVEMDTRCVEEEEDFGWPVKMRRGLDVAVSSVSVSLSEM